jgi:hypothetical protein
MTRNKLKTLIISISILISLPLSKSLGQNSTSSPYSVFGFGVLEDPSHAINSGMGNSGVAMPSAGYLNYLNPASLSALDSMAFYFNIQGKGMINKFSMSGKNQSNFDSNIEAFAFGFRLTPFWSLSLGLYSFSSVGYEIDQENDILGSTSTFPVTFEGSGGLSRVTISNAVKIFHNLSAGVDASFIWGSTDKIETSNYSSVGESSIVDTKKWYFNNLFLRYGLQYSAKLGSRKIFAGATWQPETNIYATFNQTIKTSGGSKYYDEDDEADDVFLPQIINFGLGSQWDKGWRVSADCSFAEWSKLNGSSTLKGDFSDSYTISGGAAYSHPKNKHKLINRMEWRAGAFFTNGFLNVKGQRIGEKGITTGLSIPINQAGNTMDIAYQYSIKGKSSAGLIREEYHTIKIGFSVIERWFAKQKFY